MKATFFLKKVFDQITRWSGFLATIVLVIMMLDIVVDVCARWLKVPIYGVFELNGLLIGINVFLGAALVQKNRKNIGITFLRENIPDRASHIIEAVMDVICVAFFGYMCYVYTIRAIEAVQTNEVIMGYISFPLSPMKVVMAVGLLMLTIQLIIDFIWNLNRIFKFHNREAIIIDKAAEARIT